MLSLFCLKNGNIEVMVFIPRLLFASELFFVLLVSSRCCRGTAVATVGVVVVG